MAAAVVLQAVSGVATSTGPAEGLAGAKLPTTTTSTPASTTSTPAPASTTTTPSAPAPAATTTTPPAAKSTPKPAPAQTQQSAPAQAPAPSQAAAVHHGIVPPQEPPANIPPSPNFLNSCSGTTYDDSSTCVNTTLSAIANARAQEGLGAMVLPSNWTSLTEEEQTFVITNLERTARGLPPLAGMVDSLDQAAAQGAASGQDPSPPSGYPFTEWGSNWAGAIGNPLEAMYYWMYDDGMGSSNIDCTSSNASGCWGHRDNVLLNMACNTCVIGTGYSATGWNGGPSLAELLVETNSQPTLVFSWQQEQAYF